MGCSMHSHHPCDDYVPSTTVAGAAGGALVGNYAGGAPAAGLGAAVGGLIGAGAGLLAKKHCMDEYNAQQQQRTEVERLRAAEKIERFKDEAQRREQGTTKIKGQAERNNDGTTKWKETIEWEKERLGTPPGSGELTLTPSSPRR